MRLAILSDIHANLPALEAVLADVEDAGVGELWCLGDVVGYGAQPDECTSLVAERCRVCLVGNHDLAVLGELDISSFSPAAAAAVRWTQQTAKPETLDFLRGLDPAAECIAIQAARVSLIGHSHVALFFVMGEDRRPRSAQSLELDEAARGAQAGAETRLDLSEGRWLVNPGSVGQPRDGDPRAAWLELDTDAWEATYHRVEYEIDRAASAIEATDLPEHLARRLYVGQ